MSIMICMQDRSVVNLGDCVRIWQTVSKMMTPNGYSMENPMVAVPMTHPGEHLAEILEDLGISVNEFARATGIDAGRLDAIAKTRDPITADVAVRIGKALDMTPEFWLSLQSDYDLEMLSEAAAGIKAIPEVVV